MSIRPFLFRLLTWFLLFAGSVISITPAWAATEASPKANIRIAHFSADTPTLNLFIEEQATTLQGIGFSTLSEWFSLPVGSHPLRFFNAAEAGSAALISGLLDLPENSWMTLALIGSSERQTLRLHSISHDYSEIPVGEARLSMFHAVEDAPALDLIANDNALFQFMNYPAADAPDNAGFAAVDVVSNVYAFKLVGNLSLEDFLILGEIALVSGRVYFIALIGIPTQPAFLLISEDLKEAQQQRKPDLRLLNSTEAPRQIRMAHFASGSPNLDLFINGQPSPVQGLAYTQTSDFTRLNPQSATLNIVPQGASLTPTLIPTLEVPSSISSTWLTVAVIGSTENDTLTAVLLEEDYSTLAELHARVSVFQGIPGIPPVDVIVNDGLRVRLLGYPGSQGDNDGYESFDLLEGSHDIRVVSSANPDEILVDLPGQNIIAGRNYLLATLLTEPPYILMVTEIPTLPD